MKSKAKKKVHNKQIYLWIFGIIVIICLFLIMILSNERFSSDTNVQYENWVVSKLRNYEWVDVFVRLKDMSKADAVFDTLYPDKFQVIKVSPFRVVGKVNEPGFDKLIKDKRVISIYYNSGGTLPSDAKVYYDNALLDELDSYEWVAVMIYLKSGYQKENFISSYSEEEFKDVSTSPIITGKLSREGFYKLINDEMVKGVYYDIPLKGNNDLIEVKNCNFTEDCDVTQPGLCFNNTCHMCNSMPEPMKLEPGTAVCQAMPDLYINIKTDECVFRGCGYGPGTSPGEDWVRIY